MSLQDGKLEVSANDDKGSEAQAKLEGHLALKAGDGQGGLSFDLDPKAGTFKLKAGDKDSSFENDVAISESDLGVPFYPGSQEVRVASMRAESATERSLISVRTSTDAPSQVADFYRSRFTVESSTSVESDGKTSIELKGKDGQGRTIGVSGNREKGETTTTVSVVVVSKK